VKSVNKQTVKIIDRSSISTYNDEKKMIKDKSKLNYGGTEVSQQGNAIMQHSSRQACRPALFTLAEVVWFVYIISISQIMLALCYDLEERELGP